MRRPFALVVVLIVVIGCRTPAAAGPSPGSVVVEYRNGHWFDGTDFANRSMYVADGMFY